MMQEMVDVKTRTLDADMYYRNALVLTYRIAYPWFVSERFPQSVVRMNQYYAAKAQDYQRRVRQELYDTAVQEYQYAVQNGYPVRVFEAMLAYTVTYNADCTVSLYFDRYEYTGGAHGNTVRTSDTWNLQTGSRIALSQLFACGVPYQAYIIHTITRQIAAQIAQGDDMMYFDDYEKNIAESFNPDSFYLSRQGVIIYFQQYEIAPYVSGIPEFIIPYSGTVHPPQCR